MKELIHSIKSIGHWTINIHPLKFEEKRIIKISDCKKAISDARVRLRGWDYPHIDSKGIIVGNDWVASYSDWERHREYWRFYQSAQFIHYFVCREDLQKNLRQQIYYANSNAKSFLSIVSSIYTVTEVFLFASRLAEKELFKEGLNISIELDKMQDRQLFFYDQTRVLFDDYLCNIENFKISKNFSNQEIVASFHDIAIDFMIEIFERFNMDNIPKDLLKNEQNKFLSGRI